MTIVQEAGEWQQGMNGSQRPLKPSSYHLDAANDRHTRQSTNSNRAAAEFQETAALKKATTLLVFILVIHATMLAWQARRFSPVGPEVAHLVAGNSHVLSQRFDLFRVNPPLIRSLAAIPQLLCQPSMEWSHYSIDAHVRGEAISQRDFVLANGERTLWMVQVGRWTCIPFSVLAGWICYLWAKEVFGVHAGFVAAGLWCFSPFILGHATLMTPDAHAAAVGLAAWYLFFRWLKNPQWLETILLGVVLGIAQLCKLTLLIFYPLIIVVWMTYRLSKLRMMTRLDWSCQVGMLMVALLVSVGVLNLGYLLEGTCTTLAEYRFQSILFTGYDFLNDIPPEGANRFTGSWIGSVPVPLPANYLQGIDTQRLDFERGLSSYLRGEWSDHGWWFYYLYALAVKTPVGTLLLVGLAVSVTILGHGFNASWWDETVVLVPGVVILAFVSCQTGFSVHSRYVIPALPFIFIWASKGARAFEMRPCTRTRRVLATAVVVSLVWSVVSTLWVYPHSLSYFNELVGGPRHGGDHLMSSNIDWGQDLFYLKHWLDEHPEVTLDGMAFYSSYPANLMGIPEAPYLPLGPLEERIKIQDVHTTDEIGPKPGWYAVGVCYLYSREQQYRYFLDHFQPVGSAGYSIYIYHITLDDANRVRRELGLPELGDGGKSALRAPRT